MKSIIDTLPRLTHPEVSSNFDILKDVDSEFKKCRNPNGQTLVEINPSAKVSIKTITDPSSEIKFSSQYVYQPQLDFIDKGLIPYYHDGFGIDIFTLDGVTTVTNPETGEERTISPPVAYKNENGEIQLIDGHHRVKLAIEKGLSINIIIIEGIPPENISKSFPTDATEVKVFDRFPKPSEKKLHRRPNVDQNKIIDFSSFGSAGQRTSELEKQKVHFNGDVLAGSQEKAKALRHEINQRLDRVKSGGFFPSAVGSEYPISRITKLVDVEVIDDTHILPVVQVELVNPKNGEKRDSKFCPISKTQEYFKASEANLVIIPDRPGSFDLANQPAPDGEIIIPPEIVGQVNDYLASQKLSTIAVEGDSTSPNSARAVDFRYIEVGNTLHTEVVFKLNDGREIGYLFNRTGEFNGTEIQGSGFVLRDHENNIVFLNQYRELSGLTFLELPRSFGFNLQKIESTTGYDLTQANLTHVVPLPENRNVGSVIITEFSVDVSELSPQEPTGSFGNEYMKVSQVVLKTDQEIHAVIAAGKMHSKQTNALITLDQIAHEMLEINPHFKDKTIILEKFYFAPEKKYYFRPPTAATNPNNRISQNCFPNTGTFLDYDHVEIGSVESLDPKKHYEEIPITEILNMMTNGNLDADAIADLSTGLRHQGILNLK